MKGRNHIFNLVKLFILIISSIFLLFPSPNRSIFLLVFPILWLVSWLLFKKPPPLTPLNLPVLCMFVMMLVSLFATYDIEVSLPKISGLVLGVGVFFVFVELTQTFRSLRLPVWIYLIACLGIAGIGLLGLRPSPKLDFIQPLVDLLPLKLMNLPGAEGGFHPNEVAGALLWFLPFLVVMLGLFLIKIKVWLNRFGFPKIFLAGLIILTGFLFISIEILITQSRTALIALFISVLVLAPLLIPGKYRWVAYFAFISMFAIGGWFAWQQGWLQVLYETTSAGDTAGSITTLNGRVEIWSRAIYAIQDFPLTGIGMNTFRKIMPILYPLFSIPPGVDLGHAHNEFLQVALDLGIPGLIAFIAIYFGAFLMLIQIWQVAGSSRILHKIEGLDFVLLSSSGIRALVLGIGGCLLAHGLYGITDAIALGAKPGILFWMLLGLTTGLHSLCNCNSSLGQAMQENEFFQVKN